MCRTFLKKLVKGWYHPGELSLNTTFTGVDSPVPVVAQDILLQHQEIIPTPAFLAYPQSLSSLEVGNTPMTILVKAEELLDTITPNFSETNLHGEFWASGVLKPTKGFCSFSLSIPFCALYSFS